MHSVLDELAWRGLVVQTTGREALGSALADGPISLYCGFDPTAASLHVGHLTQVLTMRRLQLAGHHPYALVGGATGLIGDPRMSGERVLNDADLVGTWVESLRGQISRFLDLEGEFGVTMVNNLDWIGRMSALEFLRDMGKHFRLGTMLAKDTVARRLQSDEGISYTEFSYQLLQGIDYLELYRRHGVTLQYGGNDQWGNLLSGVDLIHKVEGQDVHALTTPLVTKADGTKFGKSEGGAVWLDAELTSPYAFHQFWLNAADADVVNYLRYFTFRGQEEIAELESATETASHQRAAQKALADDLTTMVHGEQATAQAKAAAGVLFGKGDVRDLDEGTVRALAQELPHAGVGGTTPLVEAFVEVGISGSKGAARRDAAGGGLSLNGEKIDAEDLEREIGSFSTLPGRHLLLRRGRKNAAMVFIAD
ncbi:tyrosine--tRNA ligase [Brachybacterium saurashtrense]|uniref:Tyrosine--tRNA ligase n=1 Tax=Brachybacterium saurashtrense TaxID=556288 RepID=A0A345YNV0_9MICO|nr:tyrosine--tRNA ligase [Brachybacterium saurashtrense]AXK45602.1 tyrosine--tRNA ligase [Brachybacterium saurashtrense]RRR24619.1 tyrosine--tRNA ligase [Brachybacterium saurashtrense]